MPGCTAPCIQRAMLSGANLTHFFNTSCACRFHFSSPMPKRYKWRHALRLYVRGIKPGTYQQIHNHSFPYPLGYLNSYKNQK
jgi:hypothetical protein